MGFFGKAKGSIISDSFQMSEKQPWCNEGIMCDVALYDDHLELKPVTVKQPIRLEYSQITDVYYGKETEIVTSSKSPIGRAVMGGLLFGSLGAVVGAASGSSPAQKKISRFVFVISYTSSDGQDKILPFVDTRMYRGAKVASELKKLAGITDEQITHL